MPPTTTATFVGVSSSGFLTDAFKKVASRNLPAGAYAVMATVNMSFSSLDAREFDRDQHCELRNGATFIGGALDRRKTHGGERTATSLSMNGRANVPAGGGEVSLWCRNQGGGGSTVDYGQMMIIRTDGFF